MRSGSLCVSLTPQTLDDVFASDISGADCVEIRLDFLKEPQQAASVRWDRLPVPVIATCRGKERGGLFEGSIEEEVRILQSAANNGAQYVDIDYRHVRLVPPARVIASFHDFDRTPDDLPRILEEACAGPADIAKVATQVRSWTDNRRLFDLMTRNNGKPAIVVGMGELGQITRIAGPSRGSFLTFAASGRQSAPGQIALEEMLDVYKFRRIQRSTRLLGVLGMPVGHSLSPVLHNRAFDAAGIDFAYMKLPAPDLDDFMKNAEAIGLHGFSVTIPHKVAILPYLDRVTESAAAVGAVNTVSRSGGGWAGDNTDVYGIEQALKSVGFDPRGRKVVVMGRGGGAKAAAAAVRSAESVELLARAGVPGAGRIPCDLLVNATPVGMHPHVDHSPVEGSIAAGAVFDMVYNPPTTKLLGAAAAQGKTVVSGTAMFMAQAARQFEIWTGQRPPAEVYGA